MRSGALLVARLVRSAAATGAAAVQVVAQPRGSLEALVLQPVPGGSGGGAAGLHVRVLAVGVNFRDVLNVLGLYPGDPGACRALMHAARFMVSNA
jgi:hypothetical protein